MAKARLLVVFGVAGVVTGAALHALGVCPLVKRIWTPTWTVFSAGWVTLMLAALYYAVDLRGFRRWAFPLVVIGVNSIATYVLVHVADQYVMRSLTIHLGRGMFEAFGPAFVPLTLGAATLLIFWLILYWMYRNRVFVRI
jgi:predicted acyltransferase